ncbi:MAG: mechanosensitive ion channel family protein [Firmicutes bacterium]|nr:mechanosensitive ion channel family protein [Bacillota bacterium]
MNNNLEALKNINLGAINGGQILLALFILLICLLVIRLLTRIINRTITRLPIEPSLHGFVRSIIKILLYFLTAIIVADTLGISMTSLVAVLGIAGLAVSLAAQNALANVAGGLMLLSAKPFVVGDYIESSGISGTVVSVGLAYTKIKTPDNKIICAPNSALSGDKIINYTTESERRIDISVKAAYQNDPSLVRQALLRAANAVPGILPEPAPYFNTQSYEENGICYILRVWVNTVDYYTIKDALIEQIQPACAAAGVILAYPQLQVKLTSDTDFSFVQANS